LTRTRRAEVHRSSYLCQYIAHTSPPCLSCVRGAGPSLRCRFWSSGESVNYVGSSYPHSFGYLLVGPYRPLSRLCPQHSPVFGPEPQYMSRFHRFGRGREAFQSVVLSCTTSSVFPHVGGWNSVNSPSAVAGRSSETVALSLPPRGVKHGCGNATFTPFRIRFNAPA